jgi:hypothetical protein
VPEDGLGGERRQETGRCVLSCLLYEREVTTSFSVCCSEKGLGLMAMSPHGSVKVRLHSEGETRGDAN